MTTRDDLEECKGLLFQIMDKNFQKYSQKSEGMCKHCLAMLKKSEINLD